MPDLDLNTLMFCSILVTSICGFLFLGEALRLREAHSLIWASALACTTVAPALYMLAAADPALGWAYAVGNGVVVSGLSLVWAGTRRFNGRAPLMSLALAGPAITMLAALAEPGATGAWSGGAVFLFLFAAYSLAAAAELGLGLRYRNAVPFVVALTFNAMFYAARGIGFLVLGPEHPTFETYLGPEIASLVVIVLILVCSFSLVAVGKEQSELALRRAATRDSLTDALTRREFLARGQTALDDAMRQERPVSLLIADLDHFKAINDTYGHPIGDQVLVTFARIASDILDSNDLVCRYGGEEFVMLLPGSDEAAALKAAEDMRAQLSYAWLWTQKGLVLPTASFGVATATAGDLSRLIATADGALYGAKTTGRNKVVAMAA